MTNTGEFQIIVSDSYWTYKNVSKKNEKTF